MRVDIPPGDDDEQLIKHCMSSLWMAHTVCLESRESRKEEGTWTERTTNRPTDQEWNPEDALRYLGPSMVN